MPKNNYCALETKTYKEGCQQLVKTRIHSFLSSVLFELKFESNKVSTSTNMHLLLDIIFYVFCELFK